MEKKKKLPKMPNLSIKDIFSASSVTLVKSSHCIPNKPNL